MNYDKRYHALKNNKNFSKLNVEFLLFALVKNVEYLFLILQGLSTIGLVRFRVNLRYLPSLTLKGEWFNFVGNSFNPFWLYYRFMEIFFLVIKGILINFVEALKSNLVIALILCILIVNIWLAYKNMNYGYSKRDSKKHNLFLNTMKQALFKANLVERALWMMLFIDFIGFILNPEKTHIIFLLVIYLLVVSVKLTHKLSNTVIGLTHLLEKKILNNKYILYPVITTDITLIYLDGAKVFTLFIMVLLYCAMAQLVFLAVRDSKRLLKYSTYLFNAAVIMFFLGVIGIYGIAYLVVQIPLTPFHAYNYYKKGKLLTDVHAEYLNMALLGGLLMYYFKIFQRIF